MRRRDPDWFAIFSDPLTRFRRPESDGKGPLRIILQNDGTAIPWRGLDRFAHVKTPILDVSENLANELAKARLPINELDLQFRPEAAKTAQLPEQEHEKAVAPLSEAAGQELAASMAQDYHPLEDEHARSASMASN